MSREYRDDRDTDNRSDNRNDSRGDSRGDGGRGGSGGGRGGTQGRRFRRRKICRMCIDKVDIIDFKDARMLSNFVPERGKIMPRRLSGMCAMHQRMLAEAIKRARNIALLPYAAD